MAARGVRRLIARKADFDHHHHVKKVSEVGMTQEEIAEAIDA
jgi:alkylhydroperoxidase family enzyme